MAQLSPPNAIDAVPAAAWAKTTTSSRARLPDAASPASDQQTTTFATLPISTLSSMGRSRSRVAAYCSSWSRVRLATKRASVQLVRPNSRNSLLAGGSTANR